MRLRLVMYLIESNMIEIYKNLFVGSEYDYEINKHIFNDWMVVHACKEPYHRKALGYTGRAAPKDSLHYYFLYDIHNHLILNIVDVLDPRFFNDGMIDEAINYCLTGLQNGKKVLIHCNQGESRAPTIALMVLKRLNVVPDDFDEALNHLKSIYKEFNPNDGILEYARNRWDKL